MPFYINKKENTVSFFYKFSPQDMNEKTSGVSEKISFRDALRVN